MNIEQFVAQCEGTWRSMRSSHSLSFQQFENIISEITIKSLPIDKPEVLQLLNATAYSNSKVILPFSMKWDAESDWNNESSVENSTGSCILIAIPESEHLGLMLRNLGYAESIQAISQYEFTCDSTFNMTTKYSHSFVEEKIWFISENLRCRSSVLRSSSKKSILQTSFASEIRRLNK